MNRGQFALLERRRHVASLYLQGKFQHEIGAVLGCSQQIVSNDIRWLSARWLAESHEEVAQKKALELQRIDRIEREAWEAWERSKAPREVRVTEESEGDIAGVSHKTTVRLEGQAGDPRFLEKIQKCVDQRVALLGLDAPKKVTFNWDDLNERQLERLAAGEPLSLVVAEA